VLVWLLDSGRAVAVGAVGGAVTLGLSLWLMPVLALGGAGAYAAFDYGTIAAEDQVVAMAMTCDNLRVQVDTAPGAANSWTATVQKNGANSSLTCTIADTGTTCSDTSNSTGAIAAGDMIQLNVAETGTATGTGGSSWSMVCYPD